MSTPKKVKKTKKAKRPLPTHPFPEDISAEYVGRAEAASLADIEAFHLRDNATDDAQQQLVRQIKQRLFTAYQSMATTDAAFLHRDRQRWKTAAQYHGRMKDARRWKHVADFVITNFCRIATLELIVTETIMMLEFYHPLSDAVCWNAAAIGNAALLAYTLHQRRDDSHLPLQALSEELLRCANLDLL